MRESIVYRAGAGPHEPAVSPAVSPAAFMPETSEQKLPAYLEDHYWWAYLRPASLLVFDHPPVVSAILWGCYGRLKRALLSEIGLGQRVLQAACVYGDLSTELAKAVGPGGRLEVVDVAPLQVGNCQRKIAEVPHAVARVADAATPGGGPYDAVCCFFLLHELPDHRKSVVVDGLLQSVRAGGKVIFVDYHRPHPLHPLKPVTSLVFRFLEPFARPLWRHDIFDYASNKGAFAWTKQTYFGGFFQKIVVEPVQDEGPMQGARS